MFCEYCGKEIGNESKFCEHCGKEVVLLDEIEKIEVPLTEEHSEQPIGTNVSKKKVMVIGTIAAIAVLLFIAGKLFTNIGNSSGDTKYIAKTVKGYNINEYGEKEYYFERFYDDNELEISEYEYFEGTFSEWTYEYKYDEYGTPIEKITYYANDYSDGCEKDIVEYENEYDSEGHLIKQSYELGDYIYEEYYENGIKIKVVEKDKYESETENVYLLNDKGWTISVEYGTDKVIYDEHGIYLGYEYGKDKLSYDVDYSYGNDGKVIKAVVDEDDGTQTVYIFDENECIIEEQYYYSGELSMGVEYEYQEVPRYKEMIEQDYIELEFTWNDTAGDGELLNLEINVSGVLANEEFVSINDTDEKVYVDDVLVAEVENNNSADNGNVIIRIFETNAIYSIRTVHGVFNYVAFPNVMLKVTDQDGNQYHYKMQSPKDDLYRARTGAWCWEPLNIEYGEMQEYNDQY